MVAQGRNTDWCVAFCREWIAGSRGLSGRHENGDGWSRATFPDRHHRYRGLLSRESQVAVSHRAASTLRTALRRRGVLVYELRRVTDVARPARPDDGVRFHYRPAHDHVLRGPAYSINRAPLLALTS